MYVRLGFPKWHVLALSSYPTSLALNAGIRVSSYMFGFTLTIGPHTQHKFDQFGLALVIVGVTFPKCFSKTEL